MRDSLEWMSVIGLLHRLQHVLVDAEGDGGGERQQRGVGQHRHHGAARQRHQQRQPRAQRRPAVRRAAPVDQRLHCNSASVSTLARHARHAHHCSRSPQSNQFDANIPATNSHFHS